MDVQKMRESRNKAEVAFTKFTQNKGMFGDGLFCFYEGEDAKYYEQRVEEYTQLSHRKIINLICGGKNEVLKVKKMIDAKNVYQDVKKAYFVDKDYFGVEKSNEIYETLGYSVENFYTSVEAFEKVLKREFGINVTEEDFKKCVNDYIVAQNKFHETVLFLNAWLRCQRRSELAKGIRKVKLSDFKLGSYYKEISLMNIELKEDINEKILLEKFPDAEPVEVEELVESIQIMRDCNQQKMFRGKFELVFFKKIIEDLIKKNKEGTYLNEKYECISINPNVDTLSSMSQFADTPNELKTFLGQYKIVS